jgi:DNA-directed RNA polymerase subunit E'/Rpb7
MRTLFATMLLSFSITTFAATQKILDVVNDQDNDVTTLSVVTNGERITGMNMKTIGEGRVKTNETFSIAQARMGIVMFTTGDHEVIRLRLTERFEPQYGGPVTIDHLFNGITGSRKSMALEVTRQGDLWALEHNGKNASRASVISNRLMGKVIGVRQIRF